MRFLSDINKYVLYCFVFALAFSIHMIGLNQIGRTWDEQFKVDMGYIALDRLGAGDLSVASWNFGTEHPMVAKYIYGFSVRPEMIRIDDGQGHYKALSLADSITLEQSNYIITGLYDKVFAVMYDFTFPRIISAIFNSLAVFLTAFLGIRFLGLRKGLLAALFLLFIPRFVVMGQLITYESLSVFLFCLTVIVCDKFLKQPTSWKLSAMLGILCGLLFWTRYNNVFVFVFFTGLVHDPLCLLS